MADNSSLISNSAVRADNTITKQNEMSIPIENKSLIFLQKVPQSGYIPKRASNPERGLSRTYDIEKGTICFLIKDSVNEPMKIPLSKNNLTATYYQIECFVNEHNKKKIKILSICQRLNRQQLSFYFKKWVVNHFNKDITNKPIAINNKNSHILDVPYKEYLEHLNSNNCKQEEKQLKDSGMSTLTVETKDTPHSSLVMSSLSETEYHYIKRDKKVDRMKIMTNNLMSITEIMNIYDFQIITETVPSKNKKRNKLVSKLSFIKPPQDKDFNQIKKGDKFKRINIEIDDIFDKIDIVSNYFQIVKRYQIVSKEEITISKETLVKILKMMNYTYQFDIYQYCIQYINHYVLHTYFCTDKPNPKLNNKEQHYQMNNILSHYINQAFCYIKPDHPVPKLTLILNETTSLSDIIKHNERVYIFKRSQKSNRMKFNNTNESLMSLVELYIKSRKSKRLIFDEGEEYAYPLILGKERLLNDKQNKYRRLIINNKKCSFNILL